jgi:hypothetical protein
MKKVIISTIASILTMSIATMAFEGDDNPAIYFRRDKAGWGKNVENLDWTGTMSKNHQQVADDIANKARSRLGGEWVGPALKVAKIESGYTCNVKGPKTKHGRAVGPLQVLVGSADSLGISVYELNSSCTAQIEAGIRHMEECLKSGVRTERDFYSCHVSGIRGWNRQLKRKAAKYRSQYIRLAQNAKVPSWVGSLY